MKTLPLIAVLLATITMILVFPGIPLFQQGQPSVAVYKYSPGEEPSLIGERPLPTEYVVTSEPLIRHDAFPADLEEFLNERGIALVVAEVRELSTYITVERLGSREVKRLNTLVLLEVKQVLRGELPEDRFYIFLWSYGYDPDTGKMAVKSTDVLYRPGETVIMAINGRLGPEGIPSNMAFMAGLLRDKPVYIPDLLVFKVEDGRVSLKPFAGDVPVPSWATQVRDVPLSEFLSGLRA